MKRQKVTDIEEEERNRLAWTLHVQVMMSRRQLEELMVRQPELRLVLRNGRMCSDSDCAPATSGGCDDAFNYPTHLFPSYKEVPMTHLACPMVELHEHGPAATLRDEPGYYFHPDAQVPLLLVDRRCIRPAPGVSWYAHGWQHAAPDCRRFDVQAAWNVQYALSCKSAALPSDLCQCILRRLIVRSLRPRLTNEVTLCILSFLQQ